MKHHPTPSGLAAASLIHTQPVTHANIPVLFFLRQSVPAADAHAGVPCSTCSRP